MKNIRMNKPKEKLDLLKQTIPKNLVFEFMFKNENE